MGRDKLEHLANTDFDTLEDEYETITPVLEIGLPFMPSEASEGYFRWPLLVEVFPIYFPGVKTSRDDFVIDVNKDDLVERMKKYFDANVSHEEIERTYPKIMESTKRYQAKDVRDELVKRGLLLDKIVRYCYRPFDVRWLYWEPATKLLDEKPPRLFSSRL